MTRPALELKLYPKLDPPTYGHQIEGYRAQWKAEETERLAKRLSDAELAAECWHFDYEDFDGNLRADPDECTDDEWAEYIERRNQAEAALVRFATLPHYDEQDAP